ncbi:Ig-like domain-containing protein [Spirillospora sp. CA-294931]|uniref:L,D-transpeptidase n=1 Tax=Spirillospora sp. CA-294931 TaxID=3240042 RepID=UPI003D92D767
MRSTDRVWKAAAIGACAVVLAAGCTGSNKTTTRNEAGTGPADAQVAITPAKGASKVRPDKGVLVKATGGKLDTVSVTTGGKQVPGTFSADRTSWRSTWTLKPSASYQVSATAKNPAGKPAQAQSAFKTLKPDETVSASLDYILEGNLDDTYGVGTPIILNFDREIFNKAEVEKALEVKAEKPVEGAWRWLGNQQVIYRTKKYWPAHQKVTVTAHMAGVRAAKGVYGVKDFTRTLEIGASRISRLNLKSHKMTVTVDGKRVRKVPISAGNGTTTEYTTTSGTHLTMEKGNPVRMISPGRKKGDPGYYDLMINYAVRISWSGEYLHQTSGEEYCLGRQNCSHGCVRQPAKDAQWFYKTVQPGDIVDITGSDRGLDWQNGWSYWELPWEKWKKGSALA